MSQSKANIQTNDSLPIGSLAKKQVADTLSASGEINQSPKSPNPPTHYKSPLKPSISGLSTTDFEVLRCLFTGSIFKESTGKAMIEMRALTKNSSLETNAVYLLHQQLEFVPTGFQLYSFNYLCNPNGSIRWIFPDSISTPAFLAFYFAGDFKTKLKCQILRLIYLLQLQSFFIKKELHILSSEPLVLEEEYELRNRDYALFTGTSGPNRKALLHFESPKGKHFVKIPISTRSKKLIEKEKAAYRRLNQITLNKVIISNVESSREQHLHMLETGSYSGGDVAQLTERHTEGILELQSETASEKRFAHFQKKNTAYLLFLAKNSADPSIRSAAERCSMLGNLIDSERALQVYTAHGDFTAWNSKTSKDQLYLYDLELSDDLPAYYDLIHFSLQAQILLGNQPIEKIKQCLRDCKTSIEQAEDRKIPEEEWQEHLQHYLYCNTALNLPIFNQQLIDNGSLHEQAYWLMHNWEALINDCMPTPKGSDHRMNFVRNFFKDIADLPYAILKGEIGEPFELKENSDIDLLVPKSQLNSIIALAKKGSYVASLKEVDKLHMRHLYIQFLDGKFLEIDLIHCLRRKDLEYCSVESIIENAKETAEGYKLASLDDQLEYIACFFFLNKAPIPDKYYQKIKNLGSEEWSAFQTQIKSKYGLEFKNRRELFDSSAIDYKEFKKKVGQSPQNSGWNRIKNQLTYSKEVVEGVKNNRGWTMTFSGPDGSGKSTILNDVQKLVSKKYRRKTVVLRHRPSVLPILSSYVHGKKKAEKIAAETLPRTGKNKSSISSLIRFMYYYCDYFFGHSYVFFKYLLRGNIVLYDRYYFDFVADPKRSNIQLSEKIVKPLYQLIHQPRHNFLLHAPAEEVRKRKQELSIEDIRSLNNSYKGLFEELSEKAEASRKPHHPSYHSIENTDRKATVLKIESIISKSL